jgi:hypothetical protein
LYGGSGWEVDSWIVKERCGKRGTRHTLKEGVLNSHTRHRASGTQHFFLFGSKWSKQNRDHTGVKFYSSPSANSWILGAVPDQLEVWYSSSRTILGGFLFELALFLEARVGFDLGVVLTAGVEDVVEVVVVGAEVALSAASSWSGSVLEMILPRDKNPPMVLRCLSSASLLFFFSFSSSALTPGTSREEN